MHNIIAISNNLYDKTKLIDKKNFVYIKNKEELNLEKIQEINPKYIFFPHWSHIIPSEIYEKFTCIIFHMTDLPYGRGGSPLQNLIEQEIYETKISAIKCEKELDSGSVYLKKKLSIRTGSAQSIYIRSSTIISKMIDIIVEKNITPTPQEGKVVHFKRRTPEMSNINFLESLDKIYDYIRMLDAPNYPLAFIETSKIKFEFTNVKKRNGELIANVKIKEKK